MAQIKISAKALGNLALPNFCPRCFWIKMHCENKLPYQIFPGIFSSIDSYTKKVTSTHFTRYNRLPSWLGKLGKLGEPVKVPHFSKFNVVDQTANVLLCGMPDEIFKREDGLYFIVDYKTSKFTETQDSLLPMYEVQLNAYAYIGKRQGFDPISGIALVYMEPQTNLTQEELDSILRENGFLMGFAGHVLPLKLEAELRIPPLLKEVRRIYDLGSPPSGNAECKDCKLLDELMAIVTGRPRG
jgi:CRISPR/Cas system-associated exonuclease Cas4 (RecB family)